MKLDILNRLNMVRLFPKTGGILQQSLVKEIAKKVELSIEEVTQIELKQIEDQITWNPKKDFEKEVDFTETEMTLLKEQVEVMDKEQRVTQDILDLCLLIRNFK